MSSLTHEVSALLVRCSILEYHYESCHGHMAFDQTSNIHTDLYNKCMRVPQCCRCPRRQNLRLPEGAPGARDAKARDMSRESA